MRMHKHMVPVGDSDNEDNDDEKVIYSASPNTSPVRPLSTTSSGLIIPPLATGVAMGVAAELLDNEETDEGSQDEDDDNEEEDEEEASFAKLLAASVAGDVDVLSEMIDAGHDVDRLNGEG